MEGPTTCVLVLDCYCLILLGVIRAMFGRHCDRYCQTANVAAGQLGNTLRRRVGRMSPDPKCVTSVGITGQKQRNVRPSCDRLAAAEDRSNGILLYGPQGTGKKPVLRRRRGEFGVNLLSACDARNWSGKTPAPGRKRQSVAHSKTAASQIGDFCALFSTKSDSIGSKEAGIQKGTVRNSGGGGREYNFAGNAINAVDRPQYRPMDGLFDCGRNELPRTDLNLP